MIIESIPSIVPDWFDPSSANFAPPADWTGCRVRVKVPINTADPAKEMSDARELLEKKYPGADLHLVQDFDAACPASTTTTTGSDEDMLREYFETVAMPEGSTREQAVAYLKTLLPGTGVFGVQAASFVSATATNVLGFDGAVVDMNRKGLTLVTGLRPDKGNKSNGAGKSTWVGLPFLGLTGKTFKGQECDDWASRHNGKPARIETVLMLPDGRKLSLLRQRRPTKLLLLVDGKDVTMGTPAASQKYIEQLTNLTWDVITNAVYIGQHEAASVFGTDKERKELFSRLLGLNRFLDVQAKLRRVSTRLSNSASSIEAEAQSAEAALHEVERQRVELHAHMKSVPKVDTKTIAALGSKLLSLDKDLHEAVTLSAKHKKDYRELTDKVRKHAADANQARGRSKMLGEQLGRAASVGDVCQLCGGIVDKASIKKYRAKLADDVVIERASAKKHENLEESVIEKRDRVEQLINAQEKASQSVRIEQVNVQRQLDALNAQKDEHDKLRQHHKTSALRAAKLRKNLSIHVGARTATLMEKAFVDTCSSACGRDGLPAFLCAAAAPRLNTAASVYRDAFESDVAVVFHATADGIDIEVVNEDGGCDHRAQSKGEASLVGIITSLAFREALVPLGVLILDEPGEGLDAQSASAFARGMNQVAERFGAAYVITHNPAILAGLEPDHHIEVVKTGKVSEAREIV